MTSTMEQGMTGVHGGTQLAGAVQLSVASLKPSKLNGRQSYPAATMAELECALVSSYHLYGQAWARGEPVGLVRWAKRLKISEAAIARDVRAEQAARASRTARAKAGRAEP